MKVLIDTNILIDYMADREPFCSSAAELIELCAKEKIDGVIALHSVLDAFM